MLLDCGRLLRVWGEVAAKFTVKQRYETVQGDEAQTAQTIPSDYLTVNVTEDEVERSENGDDVGHEHAPGNPRND